MRRKSLIYKTLKTFFCLGLLTFALPALAQTPVDGHDVVRRIADTSFEDVQSAKTLGLSMQLPQTWRSKTKGQAIYFADANTPRVMGAIFIDPQGVETIDKAFEVIAALFPTTLEGKEGAATTTKGGLIGEKKQAIGRLGGEICGFLIFLGRDAKGRQILFFAQAPKYWFNSYHAIFEDVLSAVTLP